MKVNLISHTVPSQTSNIENKNITDLIAYCARVSNPNNQNNSETVDKLISYLVKWKHWSPFEMANVCMEIETTRDIARQILRHRSFSFQEFSQRYADPTKDLDFVVRDARLQDQKNRQNSIDSLDPELNAEWKLIQSSIIASCTNAYNWAIEHGIAKEQARAVLPEGNTVSRLYMNGSIRSWIHYIELRSGNGTQKEHREIARECACQLYSVFPLIQNFISNE